jgi:hypothetical protein
VAHGVAAQPPMFKTIPKKEIRCGIVNCDKPLLPPNTPHICEEKEKVLLFVISSYLAATYKNKPRLSLIRLKAPFVVYRYLAHLCFIHINNCV